MSGPGQGTVMAERVAMRRCVVSASAIAIPVSVTIVLSTSPEWPGKGSS